MSRKLSLRGTYEVEDNARFLNHEIFSYEANDLTRGWEIEAAYIWPATNRATTAFTGSATAGHMQVCASLATDSLGTVGFDQICNTGDNRQCAWIQQGFQMRSLGEDFIGTTGGPSEPTPFLCDPQTIVNTHLYINQYSTTDSTSSPSRIWNYLVILKPKKMTPSDSILQIVKSKAQDVDN